MTDDQQPQPIQVQAKPKTITYDADAIAIQVEAIPNGALLRIISPGTGEVLAFPMPLGMAQQIGLALTAPRITTANQIPHLR